MILRRLTEHVKTQNWFAVALDFVIVVLGVFVATQVSNWNAARAERSDADYLIAALHSEFETIEDELELSLTNITRYHAASRSLLDILRRDAVPPDDAEVKNWVVNSVNLGRQSPRSAVYLQMLSEGDLRLMRNDALVAALIRFDQRIERNAFVYAETLSLIFAQDSLFDAVEFDDTGAPRGAGRTVTSYDPERLKAAQSRIEAASLAQATLRTFVSEQLDDTRAILAMLEPAP